ncbi:MAG: uracil-DNA glycosylase [Mycobacteriales bacterium]
MAAAAAACASWDELAAASSGCLACPELASTRTTVVVGEAPAAARLALVGEAPGADEDRVGRPFVGRAGRLLDQLLAEAGLHRSAVAVLNVLQCRPPGNRAPASAEVACCRGWLDRKLALVAPELVVALGLTAAGWFLGRGVRLGTVRGTVHEVGGWRVLPTYHPSAAIRYGPAGAPLAGLRADLALAARFLADPAAAVAGTREAR